MNTMKDFYASSSSASGLQDPYLGALSEIARIHHRQTRALMSDLGWQEWGSQNQQKITAQPSIAWTGWENSQPVLFGGNDGYLSINN